jgi:hypothetical protein
MRVKYNVKFVFLSSFVGVRSRDKVESRKKSMRTYYEMFDMSALQLLMGLADFGPMLSQACGSVGSSNLLVAWHRPCPHPRSPHNRRHILQSLGLSHLYRIRFKIV